ncbi:hypothetical protein N1851_000047 [Merluccius polli]|uniref:Uncharacterized protein n=1 Tax=Merluccius polli TaxID=89951 RepID=A0AA47PA25_MERPO|nr:hypothetical protein N1851_000047 [Merluccius polli]
MEAFPSEDHANDLKDLDLGSDVLPTQRSLAKEEKPFTRRGVLSTVNSIYDPLGFIAPVTIQGKAILRELTQDNGDWDSPLPQGMEEMWNTWRSSLKDLTSLQIPRTYSEISPAKGSRRELIVFCDASTKAIGSVAYLKLTDTDRNVHVGFVMGKAQRIRSYSRPEQWQYVSTDVNPADIATRSVTATHLSSTSWFHGPTFLKHPQQAVPEESTFELLNPSLDTEIRPQVSTMKTSILSKQLGSQRFSKFSSWNSLIHAIARLTHIARLFKTCPQTKSRGCKGWHFCHTAISVEELLQAKRTKGEALPKESPLKALDPFIDADGLLRVGGRIREAELQPDEKFPLIIPGKHHIATLLVRHHHQKTQHQG